jgi:rhodanese-related sulfurtransferase
MIRPNSKLLFLACLIVIFTASLAGADGFTLVSKDQLKREITNPDVAVIDVRTPSSWESSQWKVQGARRELPSEANEWMKKYPKDKTIVLYCS